MTNGDWTDSNRGVLGMLLDGHGILETDARGQPIVGDTLLVLFSVEDVPVTFALPSRATHSAWRLLADTARPAESGSLLVPGDPVVLAPRSVVVLARSE
jgi:glycogen operon protein